MYDHACMDDRSGGKQRLLELASDFRNRRREAPYVHAPYDFEATTWWL
jgi:hypothetical protein